MNEFTGGISNARNNEKRVQQQQQQQQHQQQQERAGSPSMQTWSVVLQRVCSMSDDLIASWGVDGTVASEYALRSAGTLLSLRHRRPGLTEGLKA
ncbi:hypothetical protein PoB_002770200 [Plakobranchus ocellatus]|uniref:Uncharacterized protein n=1 Tax=Plakobranchus ocellatus TaxID=259542 RepID=A0AAV4A2T7_9GAST|nr:hypothetical protein PoB_002770200 [Plakobranchus ocellatus]